MTMEMAWIEAMMRKSTKFVSVLFTARLTMETILKNGPFSKTVLTWRMYIQSDYGLPIEYFVYSGPIRPHYVVTSHRIEINKIM